MVADGNSIAIERRAPLVSWRGILAGVVAGVVTQMVLTVLGLAVGIIAMDGDGQDSFARMAIGGVIWLGISLAISAYLAGRTASVAAADLSPDVGRFNGLITGMLMLWVLTVFTVNVFFRSLNTVFGIASSAVNTAANAASSVGGGLANASGGALEALGLENEYRTLMAGFNEAELREVLADQAPQLNERQIAVATTTVRAVMERAGRNVGANLGNLSELDQIITRQAEAAQQALTGPEFVSRLQARGLSQAQAQEVARVVGQRAQELRSEAQQTQAALRQRADSVARTAAATAGRTAWGWLLMAGLIIGLATLGGQQGAGLQHHGAPVVRRDRAATPGG